MKFPPPENQNSATKGNNSVAQPVTHHQPGRGSMCTMGGEEDRATISALKNYTDKKILRYLLFLVKGLD
jgi:hypothetical protein